MTIKKEEYKIIETSLDVLSETKRISEESEKQFKIHKKFLDNHKAVLKTDFISFIKNNLELINTIRHFTRKEIKFFSEQLLTTQLNRLVEDDRYQLLQTLSSLEERHNYVLENLRNLEYPDTLEYTDTLEYSDTHISISEIPYAFVLHSNKKEILCSTTVIATFNNCLKYSKIDVEEFSLQGFVSFLEDLEERS